MPPKAELSEELNEILDTDIDFSRMTKDDLKQLHELVEQGHLIEPQMKYVAKTHGKKKLDEVIDDWHPGKYLLRVI